MNTRLRWILPGVAALSLMLFGGLYAIKHPAVYRLPSESQALQQITFYALGDQGGGGKNQNLVAKSMEQLAGKDGKLDFVTLLGDNFYETHAMAVDSQEWKNSFENVYVGSYLSRIPFYAVLGNHDYRHQVDGVPNHPDHVQIEYSQRGLGSNRWRMPARYYSVDFGKVDQRTLLRIVFVDTSLKDEALEKQTEIIRQRFLSQPGDPLWKMVVGHHTVKSFGKHHGDESAATRAVLQAMQEAKVDVYLSGHDHNQQLIAIDGEPLYVINGSGGRELYKNKVEDGHLRFFRADYGFVRFNLDAQQLGLDFIDTQARPLASYRLERACRAGITACLKASANGN